MPNQWAGSTSNRFFKSVAGYPQIAEVRKEPAQTTNIGGGWHTDHSYDQIPALGSILLAREVSPRGGDTMFASMTLAYEALSDGLKKTLKGLRAVHTSHHVFGLKAHEDNPERKDRFVNAGWRRKTPCTPSSSAIPTPVDPRFTSITISPRTLRVRPSGKVSRSWISSMRTPHDRNSKLVSDGKRIPSRFGITVQRGTMR